MGRDYIPEADGLARTWFQAFANNIAAAPSMYMLTTGQAESISDAVDRFIAALAVSSNEATRTKSTIAEKDDARSIATDLCRAYARLIKVNAGITDGDKIAIGVPPVNVSRRRREVPQSSPNLKMLGATPCVQVLTFQNSLAAGRALPFGATHLQLFMAVGDKRVHGASEAALCGCFTKNPIRVTHDFADAGKVATFFGRWVSQRGEFGPWSLPAVMTIAA